MRIKEIRLNGADNLAEKFKFHKGINCVVNRVPYNIEFNSVWMDIVTDLHQYFADGDEIIKQTLNMGDGALFQHYWRQVFYEDKLKLEVDINFGYKSETWSVTRNSHGRVEEQSFPYIEEIAHAYDVRVVGFTSSDLFLQARDVFNMIVDCLFRDIEMMETLKTFFLVMHKEESRKYKFPLPKELKLSPFVQKIGELLFALTMEMMLFNLGNKANYGGFYDVTVLANTLHYKDYVRFVDFLRKFDGCQFIFATDNPLLIKEIRVEELFCLDWSNLSWKNEKLAGENKIRKYGAHRCLGLSASHIACEVMNVKEQNPQIRSILSDIDNDIENKVDFKSANKKIESLQRFLEPSGKLVEFIGFETRMTLYEGVTCENEDGEEVCGYEDDFGVVIPINTLEVVNYFDGEDLHEVYIYNQDLSIEEGESVEEEV